MLLKNFTSKKALQSNRFRISSFFLMILLCTISFTCKTFAQTNITTSGSYTQGALTLIFGSNPTHVVKFYSGTGTSGKMNTTDLSGVSGGEQRWDVSWRVDAGNHSGTHVYSTDFVFNFSTYGVSVNPGTASNYVIARRTGTSGNWTTFVTGASSTTSTEVKFSGISIDCDDDFYYSLFSLDTIVSPLPVTWLSINASSDGIKNIINWTTATEVNNDRFEIERAINAKDFERIGTVKGAGNSSQNLYYEFIDNMPIKNCVYRIKQIDYNGKFEYSPMVMPKISNDLIKPEIVIYPNPAIAGTNVILDLKNIGIGENSITVSDIYGKVVYEAIFEKSDKILTLNNLPTGFYTVTVYNRYSNLSQKLMVRN